MIPVALHIENFGPFRSRQSFYFPSEPGLYFLWGENREEPRLEANGAGKSKLWEALCWVLYGKTPRGLKAGDVANWEAGKGAKVEFVFAHNVAEETCCMTRTWSPNRWTLVTPYGDEDLAKDATNPVLGLLQLDFLPFLYCILMAQSMPMFLDLEADKKTELFAEIMQLDVWLEFSARASERAKLADRELRDLEQKIAQLEGQLTATERASTASAADAWERDREERLQALESRHSKLMADLRRLETKLPELEAQENRERKQVRASTQELDGIKLQVQELQKTRDAQDRALAQAEQAVKSEEGSYKELRGQCPLCEQEVSTATQKKLHRQHLERLQELVRADGEQAQHLAETEAELNIWLWELKRSADALEVALEVLEAAEVRVKNARRDAQLLNRDLDEIEERSERVENEVSPFVEIQAEEKARADRLRKELRRLRHDEDRLSSEVSLSQNWVRWFKEIRLQQIGEALQQLEIEVNSCLNDLGLVDWELRFDVDRESKKGTIQRGFAVTVLSPHNDRPVPWKAWSGGESQRLRLATNQGLANLIRARTGTTLNLEVWDEPTQHLSAQGVADLLDSLADRAQREGRQIWIVDHRTLGYARFAGSVGVIKDKNGASHFTRYSLPTDPATIKHLDDQP